MNMRFLEWLREKPRSANRTSCKAHSKIEHFIPDKTNQVKVDMGDSKKESKKVHCGKLPQNELMLALEK